MACRCVAREGLNGDAAALDGSQVRAARDAVHGDARGGEPRGEERAHAARADHAYAVRLARADGRGVHGGAQAKQQGANGRKRRERDRQQGAFAMCA